MTGSTAEHPGENLRTEKLEKLTPNCTFSVAVKISFAKTAKAFIGGAKKFFTSAAVLKVIVKPRELLPSVIGLSKHLSLMQPALELDQSAVREAQLANWPEPSHGA